MGNHPADRLAASLRAHRFQENEDEPFRLEEIAQVGLDGRVVHTARSGTSRP